MTDRSTHSQPGVAAASTSRRPAHRLAWLDGLSPEQQAVVLEAAPRVLVLAGAGSGKTRVLVARLAHLLLTRQVTPDRVLAFSFTRKACGEIDQRLRSMYRALEQPDEPPELAFTFNGFAHRLIRRHHRALGFVSPPQVLSEDSGALVEAFTGFLEGLPEPPLGTPREVLERLRPGPRAIVDPTLAGLEPAFMEWKRQQGVVELSDQVPLAATLLAGPVGEALRRHLQLVLVDEFQDIDPVQEQLFARLLGPETRFMVFGDDDQAIYRWRGARPELIRAYHRDRTVVNHLLTTNYRCRGPILALAGQIVAGDRERIDKTARAHAQEGVIPVGVAGPGQADRVVKVIRRLHAGGRRAEALAVLVRDHADAGEIKRALDRAGIPVATSLDGPGIRLMTFHASKGLEFPVVLMPFLDHGRFPNTRRLDREQTSLHRRLQEARRARTELLRLQRHRARLTARSSHVRRIGGWLAQWVAQLPGGQERLDREDLDEPSPGFESVSELSTSGRTDAPEVSPSRRLNRGLTRWLEVVWRWLPEFLVGWMSEERRRHRLDQRIAGCDARARWFPALQEAWEAWPSARQAALDEERRLCYVAMTRAQEELWLFCARRERCSEFLDDLPGRLIHWEEVALEQDGDAAVRQQGRRR